MSRRHGPVVNLLPPARREEWRPAGPRSSPSEEVRAIQQYEKHEERERDEWIVVVVRRETPGADVLVDERAGERGEEQRVESMTRAFAVQ